MQTAHEFFIHGLNEMLDAENQILEALAEQAQESTRPEIRKGFEQHRAQTERQIQRLEQCLQSIGEGGEEAECAGVRGLVQEHDDFKEEDPSEEILDIFNVGAAAKIEHYEIASYESLIRLAQLMNHRKAVQLLSQNLREEQQMLKKVEGISKKLKPAQLGMEEELVEEQPARRSRRRRAA